MLERLGYIQIDSIAVVNRAHHHTVWNRLPGYRKGGLYELLRQRRIFEYWGHAASYLPMGDYRYYLPLMRSYRERPRTYMARAMKQYGTLLPEILRRIEQLGPQSSADLGDEHGSRAGQWWDWKPAKVALELLLWRGELMVSERRGFQRVYDLTGRVLPRGTDTTEPDEEELAEFIVRRTLCAYGIAREKDFRGMLRIGRLAPVSAVLRRLLASGKIALVSVAGLDRQLWYCETGLLQGLSSAGRRRAKLHLLSPFDNLVIQRDRLQGLFNFEYTIECYVPEPKRRFGYFSLPLLYGDQLIGRLDAKARRDEGLLEIRSLHFEEGFRSNAEFEGELADGLRRFAAFNACGTVRVMAAGHNISTAAVRRVNSLLA